MTRTSTGRMGTLKNSYHGRDLQRDLDRGDDIVVRLIGGMAVGGGAVAAATGGVGVLIGGVIGGIVGVVAPRVASALFRQTRRGVRK